MHLRLLTALVLAAAVLPLSSAAAPAPIRHPAGGGDVVLRVSSGGGFVPVEFNLRALPEFTLYGDGTVIVPGAVIQIYPGPALHPLVRSKLSERRVQALLKRAQAAGLLARRAPDYGDMGAIGVADAPTTTLLLNAGGRQLKHEAYALGIAAGGGRLSAKQVAARRALARFIAGLPRSLAGSQYVPRALAVYVGPYRGEAQRGAKPIIWPLQRDLAGAGTPVAGYHCFTVGGQAARTLLATLRRANEQSQWAARADTNSTYRLIARPLLPDQRGCA